MKEKNLIKIAKSYKSRQQGVHEITKEQINLAVLFLKGEITLTQVTVAMYKDPKKTCHATYVFLVRALREAYKLKKIK